MTITFTLSSPGLADLSLGAGTNLRISEFDLGAPVPRVVTQPRPTDNGVRDTTLYYGERNIAVNVQLLPDTTWDEIQALRQFLVARRVSTLTMRGIGRGAPDLQATVKGREAVWVHERVELASKIGVAVCQWSVPSGVLEAATQSSLVVRPGSDTTADGLEFGTTLEFGPTLEFPLTDPPGTAPLTVAGNTDVYPVIRMFGPFGDEGNAADETVLGNITTGKELVFTGTGINAGSYLEVDFLNKTILVNSDPAQSRYSRLKFPDSEWWRLEPGTNEIAFRPDTFSGNAQARVLWRDAWF